MPTQPVEGVSIGPTAATDLTRESYLSGCGNSPCLESSVALRCRPGTLDKSCSALPNSAPTACSGAARGSSLLIRAQDCEVVFLTREIILKRTAAFLARGLIPERFNGEWHERCDSLAFARSIREVNRRHRRPVDGCDLRRSWPVVVAFRARHRQIYAWRMVLNQPIDG